MHILLTNDDGIDSEGIRKLALALRSKGKYKVTVMAPDKNHSGISHAISFLGGPLKISKREEDTWSCSGYPADCVIVALLGALPERPDLVISGINQGANLGTDISYSGTAAAARQASLMGVPAIALSLDAFRDCCWDMAASWSADHLEELIAFWGSDTFVNVNIPNNQNGPGGIVKSWPTVKRYDEGPLRIVSARDGSGWCFFEGGEKMADTEAGSDCDVVARNFVSVSPVFIHPVVRRDLCPSAPDYAAVSGRDRAPIAPEKA